MRGTATSEDESQPPIGREKVVGVQRPLHGRCAPPPLLSRDSGALNVFCKMGEGLVAVFILIMLHPLI